MEKLNELKSEIEVAGNELVASFEELTKKGKISYRIAKEIRKTCQTLKIKAQELRKAATEAWKSSKTS